MNRCLAFLLALLFATVTVSSACASGSPDGTIFTLGPARGGTGQIRASFRDEWAGKDRNSWSAGFMPSELIGLDISGFRGSGTRPLRFAVVHEAGRLDCAGSGGSSRASGRCGFTADPGFSKLLASRGIGKPTREQSFGLMALDVRRALVDAIASASYPTPTIDQLMALSAVGADGRYIEDMAHAGYRPRSVEALIEFKALGITPEWIGGFARIGYANIPGPDLVQLKAMNITPDFVSGFDGAGYGRLPAETLVELKALGITPDFARAAGQGRSAMPPVKELVEMKISGRNR